VLQPRARFSCILGSAVNPAFPVMPMTKILFFLMLLACVLAAAA
jgi:hypothetical protein